MAASTTDALFVTANVGSIFEDPTSMLKIWCDEFLTTVSRLSPKLIALHCQEVGGKNYERSMQHVSDFVKLLMSSEELQQFDKVRIFLDEDYSSAEHFTALGNFYFIHESIPEENAQIFNFHDGKFEPVVGKEVYSENIEDVATKEKSKFPQEIFPECKWSRKGFMRTRWNLNGTVFDLVNIHLFHDASNFVAMESFPSVYCKNRQRALDHTLKRFHTDQYGIVPFFVFGDFNFRTDTQGVVKKLSEGLNAVKIQSSKSTDHAKLQYRDESSQQVVLTLGKKEFSHQDHQKVFVGDDSDWLRSFDRELESYSGQLYEFGINFPPSYPYVEDSERGEMYMQTRCPSWCDRVFFSNSARVLVDESSEDSTPEYGLIGLNACMGDHKPVFLRASLIGSLGTVSCCALPAAPCTSCLSAASPVEHICRLCSKQTIDSASFPMFDEPKQDQSGLVVPKFHRQTSPYTPDSTDTEPDLGEEMSLEGQHFQKIKNDRRLHRYDVSSRKRLHVSTDPPSCSKGEDLLCRNSSYRKSASKIPVRVLDPKENVPLSPPHVSKIPVPKHTLSNQERDSVLKGRNGKPSLTSKDSFDRRLTLDKDKNIISLDPLLSPKHSLSQVDDLSLIPKLRSADGRKHLCRQMNIDEQSSDSDSASVDLVEDQYVVPERRSGDKILEESKVEIQFSLVETSPVLLSPIDSEADGLLTATAHGLGGSTTDSGVSVSPDLSVATSPSTDGPDKSALEPVSNVESNEEDDSKTDSNPLSLDRFSFVRRIQSASAMERKSSFPLPSTIFIDHRPSLTGFGGSGSNLWGMRTCRCMSDSSWRQRSSTISHSILSSKADSRIRLISTSSRLDRSLPRLQSHHSSSDEEWFEEIVNESQEGSNADNEQSFCDESKMKHTTECSKRLSTHEELITSDTNMSSDDNATEYSERVLKTLGTDPSLQTRGHSQSSSEWAIAAVGKTLAQTCFVDTERALTDNSIDPSEKMIAGLEPYSESSKQEGENEEEGEEKKSLPVRSKLTMDSTAPTTKVEETPLQPRRTSATSNSSKAPNSRNCKACCVLL